QTVLIKLSVNDETSSIESYSHYSTLGGLTNNFVTSLNFDDYQRLWIGTERGLNVLTRPEDNKGGDKYKIKTITKSGGFVGGKVNIGASSITDDGLLLHGTGKGLSKYDVSIKEPTYLPPETFLSEIQINEKRIHYNKISDSTYLISKGIGSGLKASIETRPFFNVANEIRLSYDLNHLTFLYTAIDWSSSNEIKYQYMIQGLDKDWSTVTNQGIANYRNIPYGRYTFQVRAVGRSGVWSKPAEYEFQIYPPWWHTWWARLLFLGFAVAIIWLSVRWRIRRLEVRLREKNLYIETIANQNKRLKDFSFVISHNIRMATANLSGLISLVEGEIGDFKVFEMLKGTNRKLDSTVSHLNQLLSLKEDKKKISQQECDVKEVVEKAIAEFNETIANDGVVINVNIEEKLTVYADKSYFENIISQLLKNSLTFCITESSKKVDIQAWQEDGKRVITVSDNGLGLDMKNFGDKLFTLGARFHSEKSGGEGLGLYIVKAQLDLMNWKVEVMSQENRGSTFKIICNV
ncbi:MAG: HAMP domain-containing sensor histidine kinase, partial [Bacteroidota bacterium]